MDKPPKVRRDRMTHSTRYTAADGGRGIAAAVSMLAVRFFFSPVVLFGPPEQSLLFFFSTVRVLRTHRATHTRGTYVAILR